VTAIKYMYITSYYITDNGLDDRGDKVINI